MYIWSWYRTPEHWRRYEESLPVLLQSVHERSMERQAALGDAVWTPERQFLEIEAEKGNIHAAEP